MRVEDLFFVKVLGQAFGKESNLHLFLRFESFFFCSALLAALPWPFHCEGEVLDCSVGYSTRNLDASCPATQSFTLISPLSQGFQPFISWELFLSDNIPTGW